MFSNLVFAAATMAVFVAAAPGDHGGGHSGSGGNIISNSCNTGSVQCCNQVFESESSESDFLKGIFNIDTGPTTGQVGTACSPVTGIGASGTSCSSQSVFCNGNSFNIAVVFGCSPVNING